MAQMSSNNAKKAVFKLVLETGLPSGCWRQEAGRNHAGSAGRLTVYNKIVRKNSPKPPSRRHHRRMQQV
jgi:hypothetical protein